MKSLHSDVTVRDLERSKRLYGDLVGTVPFQVTSQTRPEGGGDRSVRGGARRLAHGQHAMRVEENWSQPRTEYGEGNWNGTGARSGRWRD